MSAETVSLLVADDWLTAVIGRPAFSLGTTPAARARWFDANGRPAAELASTLTGDAFAYAKGPVTDVAMGRDLVALGFFVADANLVLEKEIDPSRTPAKPGRVRFAEPGDEVAVAAVARSAFSVSRFHMDDHFAPGVADAVKEAWARGYFTGTRGTEMVVGLDGRRVAGFVQLLRPEPDVLAIDLMAVAETARGRGLASDMIAFAESWCGGAKVLRAGTQAANRDAIRTYEANGLRFIEASYVFHRHGSPGQAGSTREGGAS